jgi:hypothetical protein
MPRPDDDLPRGPAPDRLPRPAEGSAGLAGLLGNRTLIQVGGFVLAVAATLAVFLTDNRQYLRVAVVAVAWAFVLAVLAASRRGADQATAAAREAQLRQAYELELEREVAARQAYELELEHDLRRDAEDAMRDELDALRDEIASLGRLRDELAPVTDLRHEIAGLAGLRDDVARLAGLREDVAALNSLRQDLGQLAELRADLSRLRVELTEQLSSEMLVERIVMRTQGGARFDSPARRDVEPLDVPVRWSDETSSRELIAGWPGIPLDEPRVARHVEPVRADRPTPGREASPAPIWSSGPQTSGFHSPPPSPAAPGGSWTSAFDRPVPPPPVDRAPSETPLEWLAARSLLDPDAPRPVAPPPVPPLPDRPQVQPPTEARAAVRPSPHPRPRPTPPPPSSARPQPDSAPVRRHGDDLDPSTAERPLVGDGTAPTQDAGRLAEILAENGVSPSTGSRRRRRYREDGEPDDVLARVLGLS